MFWSEPAQMWARSRYDDVRAALVDWRTFSNEAGAGSTHMLTRTLTTDTELHGPPPRAHHHM